MHCTINKLRSKMYSSPACSNVKLFLRARNKSSLYIDNKFMLNWKIVSIQMTVSSCLSNPVLTYLTFTLSIF
jgi:hypothetical protein